MKALVSIHDVMPHTMGEVTDLIRLCRRHGVGRTTLLVVPGLEWRPDQVRQLRQWQQDGHVLAAHGWRHRCEAVRTWAHRGHSYLLSRNAAEHMSLETAQVSQLMDRSAKWFQENGFAIPELYVPPAWALGKISPDLLRKKPFTMVETLGGLLFPHQRTRMRLPMVGFEADTPARRTGLRMLNRSAMLFSCLAPLRVSIHPYDHLSRLRSDLVSTLRQCTESVSYSELLARAAPAKSD